jgi:hypothetical protein
MHDLVRKRILIILIIFVAVAFTQVEGVEAINKMGERTPGVSAATVVE